MAIDWDPVLVIVVVIFLIPILYFAKMAIRGILTPTEMQVGKKKIKTNLLFKEQLQYYIDMFNSKYCFLIGLIFIVLNFLINLLEYVHTTFYYILGFIGIVWGGLILIIRSIIQMIKNPKK